MLNRSVYEVTENGEMTLRKDLAKALLEGEWKCPSCGERKLDYLTRDVVLSYPVNEDMVIDYSDAEDISSDTTSELRCIECDRLYYPTIIDDQITMIKDRDDNILWKFG